MISYRKYVWLIIGLGMCQMVWSQKKSKVIKSGAELIKVDSSFSFTEGPTADAEGNIYFTDQPNNKIWRWNAEDNSVDIFLEESKRSNGLYMGDDGFLWSCADETNELIKIDSDKNMTVVLDNFKGKRFNGPNDLWIDGEGGVYFTDPYYQRDWWQRDTAELKNKDIYYLKPDHKTVQIAATDFVQPNGIIGSVEENRIYIADIKDKKIYEYTMIDGGILVDRRLLTENASDGMTLDAKGNLYITNEKGVTVFNNLGEQIENIPIPEPWTANVCFGGKGNTTLFITASKSIYTIEMKVKGL